jgi:hypothetical protein
VILTQNRELPRRKRIWIPLLLHRRHARLFLLPKTRARSLSVNNNRQAAAVTKSTASTRRDEDEVKRVSRELQRVNVCKVSTVCETGFGTAVGESVSQQPKVWFGQERSRSSKSLCRVAQVTI